MIDVFGDPAGEPRVAILSPFGRSFHHTLLLATQGELRARGGGPLGAVFSNVGILLRPAGDSPESVVNAVCGLRPEELVERVLAEVQETPFFASRFRHNAARALLLPRRHAGRRLPLWLQRLRAHDLQARANQATIAPIMRETVREILEDELPVDAVCRFLQDVRSGGAELVVRRTSRPSPFAASLIHGLTAEFLYEPDRPHPRARGAVRSADRSPTSMPAPPLPIPADILAGADAQLQGAAPGRRARSGIEFVALLRRIGDLDDAEAEARCEEPALHALPRLAEERRIFRRTVFGVERWIAADDEPRYRFTDPADLESIVDRFVAAHAALRVEEIVSRYPPAGPLIERRLQTGAWVRVRRADGSTGIAVPEVTIELQRRTLAERRRRVRPVAPASYAAALVARHLPADPPDTRVGLAAALRGLVGVSLPVSIWIDVLSGRVRGPRWEDLEGLVRTGALIWYGTAPSPTQRRLGFAPPDRLPLFLPPPVEPRTPIARRIVDLLSERGALFTHQIASAVAQPPSTIVPVLQELVWASLVTNDTLAPAHLARSPGAGARIGRWSLLPPRLRDRGDDDLAEILDPLLDRHIVLSREILADYRALAAWGDLYARLVRMEWAGEVERGRFVDSLAAPQFARPEAVPALGRTPDDRMVLLPTMDPINPYGAAGRFPVLDAAGRPYPLRAHPSHHLILWAGRPILAVERHARRLVPLIELTAADRRRALALLPRLLREGHRPSALRIRSWDRRPIAESGVAPDLERCGFMREDTDMVLYRRYSSETEDV